MLSTLDNQLKELCYVKGKDFEIDFYDEVNSRLLQVTYTSDKIEEKEIRSLLKAEEMLRTKELIMITYDIEGEEEREGKKIKLIPYTSFY
ncbi:ATP-binding protein [Sulfolobus islandicus]|nr:ATP-binding protein [Sulfolobus islandicus]WCM36456.1 ATP-binding protein [Sulfolobus islandicus]